MEDNLSKIDLAIWLTLIAGKVVLCVCLLKKHFFKRLPLFSTYAVATAVKSILLLIFAFVANYSVYYYAFYITSHMVSLLAFATLIELSRNVLPGLNLPRKEKAAAWLAAALGGVFIFVTLWPIRFFENRLEIGSYLAVAVVFIFIAVYSRYLGLYASRLIGGISSSLGLLYLVEGIAKAMMAHYSSPTALAIRQISQATSVLAVISWIVVILSPWGRAGDDRTRPEKNRSGLCPDRSQRRRGRKLRPMTALPIARREMPLDDLVVRVYHLELKECRDEAEFREAVRLVLRNMDEVLDALCFYRPVDRRIHRAVDRVKLKAAHLRNLCTAVPESFDHPEQWRQVAIHITANYEQFRIEAGCCTRSPFPAPALACCGLPCERKWIEKDGKCQKFL